MPRLTKSVAFIPARSGSKRIPDKNIQTLNDEHLIAHTIRPLLASKAFDDVIVVTDSRKYADIAEEYGAEVPNLRPSYTAQDNTPDIEWLKWILELLDKQQRHYDIFGIFRPTSPFRSEHTIKRAFKQFVSSQYCDSLRAVQKVSEHPGKMWTLNKGRLLPLLPFEQNGTPFHSSPYDTLPEIYIQNASLEIAWTKIVGETGSIAGTNVVPFLTDGLEGFDINTEDDLVLARHYASIS